MDTRTREPIPFDLRPSVVTLVGFPSWLCNKPSFWPMSAHPCTLSLTKATVVNTAKGAQYPHFPAWINSAFIRGEPECIPENVESMVCTVPLGDDKQDPRQLLQRLSYLISDVICFARADIPSCASAFLDWIGTCMPAGPHDAKPIACIILPQGLHVGNSSPEKAFLTECQTRIGDYEQKFNAWFADIQCHRLSKDGESLPVEIRSSLEGTRVAREKKHHLWSPSILQALCRDAVVHFAKRPLERFSFVKALMPVIRPGLLREKPWLDINLQPYPDVVDILAYCFARSIVGNRHVFMHAEVFEEIFARVSEDVLGPGALWATSCKLGERLVEYEQTISGWRSAHIEAMQKHSLFWQRTYSRGICFMCMVNPCQVFMPCGHAMCESCYGAFGCPNAEHTTTFCAPIRYEGCLLCGQVWDEPFEVLLRPPSSGIRVLALDGGGIKGIIAIEILRRLEEEIPLAIPLRQFFDLIGGSSVGKLISSQTAVCLCL